MNFQQLLTFTTVVAEGNMTAAAEKLYLTQPAVSQQIRNLEEELGVDLLLRGVRQAKPTLQGQLFYDYAKRILALTQAAQVAVQSLGQDISGDLKVGTLNSLGLYLLSNLIGNFLRHHPGIQLDVEYLDAISLVKALETGAIDIAILPDIQAEYGVSEDNFSVRPLLRDEVWLVAASRSMALASNAGLEELAGKQPFVLWSGEYLGFDSYLKTELKRRGWADIQPTFQSNNVGTLKKVLENGLGWGFVPSHSIQKQIRAGRLNRLEAEHWSYGVDIRFYSRKGNSEKEKLTDVFYKALKPSFHQSVSS